MNKLSIIAHALVTLQGSGQKGIGGMIQKAPVAKKILRPPEIAKKIYRIDYATGLSASATIAMMTSSGLYASEDRTGIIVCTQKGNTGVIRDYVERVNRNRNSPSYYAASGYNICAGVAAMAAGIRGVSIVLAGRKPSLADALVLASNYLKREEIDVMCINCVDVDHNGNSGVCISFAVSLQNTAPGITCIQLVSQEHGTDLWSKKDDKAAPQAPMTQTHEYFSRNHPALINPLKLWEMCGSTGLTTAHSLSFPDSALVDHIIIQKRCGN